MMKYVALILMILALPSMAQDMPTGLLVDPLSDEQWEVLPEFTPGSTGAPVAARSLMSGSRGDIRDIIGTTSVKNQRNCGSCVSNSIITQAEYALRRRFVYDLQMPKSSAKFDLSVSQVLSCLNLGCTATTWQKVVSTARGIVSTKPLIIDFSKTLKGTKLVLNSGIEDQDNHSVHGCVVANPAYAIFRGMESIDQEFFIFMKLPRESSIKDAVLRGYGVGVDIRVAGTDAHLCGSTIGTTITSSDVDHSAVIVGFDDEIDGGVWYIQNSWSWSDYSPTYQGTPCHNNGILKVKYGALNLKNARVMVGMDYTPEFLQQVKPSWCYNSQGKYSQFANGYSTLTQIRTNTQANIQSNGFTTGSGLNARRLNPGVYRANILKIQRVVEVPLGSAVTHDVAETFGVSAAVPDGNKGPWSEMTLGSEIVNGIARNFATFTTFVWELWGSDGSYKGFWPTRPEGVQFRYNLSGSGACSNSTTAPSVNISYDQLSYVVGREISFSGSNSGGWAESWYWQFGDGSSSIEQFPSHKYTKPGIYSVMAQATNRYGISNSNTLSVTVKPNLIPIIAPLLLD